MPGTVTKNALRKKKIKTPIETSRLFPPPASAAFSDQSQTTEAKNRGIKNESRNGKMCLLHPVPTLMADAAENQEKECPPAEQ